MHVTDLSPIARAWHWHWGAGVREVAGGCRNILLGVLVGFREGRGSGVFSFTSYTVYGCLRTDGQHIDTAVKSRRVRVGFLFVYII